MTCSVNDQVGLSSRYSPVEMTLILMTFTAALRLIIAATTGLGYGESYYTMAVMHPDWSYFDQPGMAFWISWCFTQLFGLTNFSVRLPFVLMFIGTTGFLFCLTRRLFNERAGFYAVLVLNLSLVFGGTTGTWLQPDGPLMFFWLWAALVISKIYFPEKLAEPQDTTEAGFDVKTNWQASLRDKRAWTLWLLFGVLLGFTALSKYHAAFLLFGSGMFAIFSRRHRHWVYHPGPYIAIILAILIASPIFIWNVQNEWASFAFQGSRAGSGDGFELKWAWFFGSIGGQMLWMLPWVGIPLASMLIYSLYRAYLKSRLSCNWGSEQQHISEVMGWCFWCAVGPIVFFTILPLWSNLGFHFHWQAPGYLMLMPILGRVMAGLKGRWKSGMIIGAWGSGVLTLFVISTLLWQANIGALRAYGPDWVTGLFDRLKEDPSLEGYDYDDLYEAFYDRGYLFEDEVFVITQRWHFAGKVHWALKGELDVVCFDNDPRNIAFFQKQEDLVGKDAILVTRETYLLPSTIPGLSLSFDHVERLPDIEIQRGGHVELTLQVYRMKNFKKSYPLPYPETERKDVFFNE